MNFVMNACLSQSTSISETSTVRTGWFMKISESRERAGQTYVRYRPKHAVVAFPPAEAHGEGEAFGEIE